MIPSLLLITDENTPPARVVELWPGIHSGVPSVSLSIRYPQLPLRDLYALCERVKSLTPSAILLVSRRLDVAFALGLSGVHLPSGGVPCMDARAYLGKDAIIVRAAHDVDELAKCRGADSALLSPVFSPLSHASSRKPLGLEGLGELRKKSPVPVLAMGGITPGNLRAVLGVGVHGVAVSGAVWRSEDPVSTTMSLWRTLRDLQDKTATG